jgi:hypothetical protein
VALDMRPRTQVISECDSWPKKYVVQDMHTLEDHDLVFDSDTVANRCAVLHEGSIADVAVMADAGAGEHMGKRPDSRPLPTSSLSHNPCGCTKTPSTGDEVVTAPHISFRACTPTSSCTGRLPQKLRSPRAWAQLIKLCTHEGC